jgi:hypothetical protein
MRWLSLGGRLSWVRSLTCASVLVVVCGVVPCAWAVGPVEVDVGPVQVRAYTLEIAAYPASATGPATVAVTLVRTADGVVRGMPGGSAFTQVHTFVAHQGVHVEVGKGLRFAQVKASLGRYGRIDLTAAGLDRARSRSCQSELHRGRSRGAVRIVPGGRYFGAIVRRQLPVAVGQTGACQDARAARQVTLAAGTRHAADQGRRVVVQLSDQLTITVTRPGRRVFVQDAIIANPPPPSVLSTSPNLSSATLRSVGPFLTGDASFSARAPDDDGGAISGALSGDLTADFDSPGPEPITNPALRATIEETSPLR